jgi:membrane protein implicated in regulation of membrane protease activity
MNSRLKTIGIIAILGFIAGIIALLITDHFIPWLIEAMPSLGSLPRYIGAGIAGAIIAIILIVVWAYLTGNKNNNRY